jgi:hypothetical protein
MDKKEKAKDQYILEIYKNEPVRPRELPFERIRHDYIDELVTEGKIFKKNYGKQFTLLAKPGHEDLCDERANKEFFRNQKKVASEEVDVAFREEIVELIVKPFIHQMSGMIIGDDKIQAPHGKRGILKEYPKVELDVEKDPLFFGLSKTCVGIHPNPCQGYQKFKEKSVEFRDNSKSISDEIRRIAIKEIAGGVVNIGDVYSIKQSDPFIEWVKKEVRGLHKKSEKEQKNFEEKLQRMLSEIGNNFSSKVEQEGDFYIYFFIYQKTVQHQVVKRLNWKVDKKICSKAEFNEVMNQRIRMVFQQIAISKKIIDSFNKIVKLKEEWGQLKNNVLEGLKKYKWLYSPNNIIER